MSEQKRKEQSFEYGAGILLVATVLVKVIGMVFKIPLSSLIGDLGFGYFSSAYDLFNPIYTIAMAGLPIAVSRVVAEHMASRRYRDVHSTLKITRRLFLVTGLTGFALMLALIYPYVKMTDETGRTIYSLFAIAPSLLFCCVMSTYRGYYEGLRNMYPTAISNIIEALGKLVLGYGFAFVVMKVSGNVAYAAAAAAAGIMVGTAAAAGYLKIRHGVKGDRITESELANSPDPEDVRLATKAIILIAIPVVLSSLANSIATLVDVTMVKWQLSNLMESHADTIRQMYASSIADYNKTAKEVLTDAAIPTFLYGVRSKAFTLYNLAPSITSALGVGALPVLAASWVKQDKALVKHNLESMFKLTAIVAMPVGFGFMFLSRGVMGLLYSGTASIEIGGKMMIIYGFAAIFAGLAVPMTSMLHAVKKQVAAVRNVAIGAAIKVVVNFIFVSIPSVNIIGAAVGTLAGYIFVFAAHLVTLIRHTGTKPNLLAALGKPLVAALGCGIAAFLMSFIGTSRLVTLAAIAVAAVVYLALLVAMNTFEEADVLALPKGEKLLKVLIKFKIIR